MAIVASNLYSGRVVTGDSGYPLGKAQDIVNGEKGTGTPLRASWVNDQWGFLQALLDAANITPSGTPDQVGQSDYLDAVNKIIREPLALKIFQSPSSEGLTEIQTSTVDAGEVYEVRKTSDDSLATVYSDATGATEIVQNGTDNKSGSDGVIEFYIADGDYYVEVGGVKVNFTTSLKTEFDTIAEAKDYIGIDGLLGHRVYIKDRQSYFEVVLTSTVTPDGFGVVQSDENPAYSLSIDNEYALSIEGSFKSYGSPTGSSYTAYVNSIDKSSGIPASKMGIYGGFDTDEIDEGAAIQAAINTGENIAFDSSRRYWTSQPLIQSASDQVLNFNKGWLVPLGDLNAEKILTANGDFAEIKNMYLVNVGDRNSGGVALNGFRNTFKNGTITGTTQGNCLEANGLESIIVRGKLKGGTANGLEINNSDCTLDNLYTEQHGAAGLRANRGSVVGTSVHSFNNGNQGFYLVGAGFSQLFGWYADTNGGNGWELFDTTNSDFMACWGFKSGQLLANKSELNITGTSSGNKFYGFRASHGTSTVKTDYSIRAGGNSNLFHGCYADSEPRESDTSSLEHSIAGKFVGCFGSLSRYNSEMNEDTKFVYLTASESEAATFKFYDRNFSNLSFNFATVSCTVTCRYNDNNIDVYEVLIFPQNGITSQPPVVTHKAGVNLLTFPTSSSSGNECSLTTVNGNSTPATLSINARYVSDARFVL